MLGVEDERGVHGAHPAGGRRVAVQQVQEVAADGLVIGLYLDALAVGGVMVPVQQRRADRGD